MKARIALTIIILVHFYVVLANFLAFFILPIASFLTLAVPWWYIVLLITPIESVIIYLSFNRSPCPLTRLENYYRKQLGMQEVHGFIGHYVIKQKWRKVNNEQVS